MNRKDTYLTEEGLEFDYTVWEDSGNYHTPSSYSVEIDKITYNNLDVSDLLFNIADEYVANIKIKIEEKDLQK